MKMCVCVRAHMHVLMHVMHKRMKVCAHIQNGREREREREWIQAYIYIYMQGCMCVRVYRYIHIFMLQQNVIGTC